MEVAVGKGKRNEFWIIILRMKIMKWRNWSLIFNSLSCASVCDIDLPFEPK